MTPKTAVAEPVENISLFSPYVPLDQGNIIVITGEYGSGKTTLATSLVPRSKLAYIDGEGSGSTTMSINQPAYHVDLTQLYAQTFPQHTKVDAYEFARMCFGILDDLEDKLTWGMVTVIDNPAGFKASAIKWAVKHAKDMGWYNTSEIKFLWGYLNNYLAERFQRIANKCGLLIIVVHLVEEYDNNDKSTGVVLPKIWDAVEQKASLVLWTRHSLSGSPVPDVLLLKARAQFTAEVTVGLDKNGQRTFQYVPAIEELPIGLALRISDKAEEITELGFSPVVIPIFPPVIRNATWGKIRGYCNSPYDPQNPTGEESPTPEEWQIIHREPSEFAKDSRKLALLTAQQDMAAAQAEQSRKVQELKVAIAKTGDEAAVRLQLKEAFGGWTQENHEQVMAFLRDNYVLD